MPNVLSSGYSVRVDYYDDTQSWAVAYYHYDREGRVTTTQFWRGVPTSGEALAIAEVVVEDLVARS